jgi:Ca2+-binding EF-hand superfamily protein
MNVYDKIFVFLDMDKDERVDQRDIKYGISYIMNKDVNEADVKEAFKKYDKDKDGKLTKPEFILAGVNNYFTKSVEDPNITASFFE